MARNHQIGLIAVAFLSTILLTDAAVTHARDGLSPADGLRTVSKRAASDGSLEQFTLTLKGKNFDALADKMYEISSTNGPWLTVEQLRQYTEPEQAHINALHEWFKEHGVAEEHIQQSPLGDHYTVSATRETIQKLFPTDQQSQLPEFFAKSVISYDVPSEASKMENGYQRNVKFQKTTEPASSLSQGLSANPVAHPSVCNTSAIDPGCIRSFYGLNKYSPKPTEGIVDLGIIGWLSETFDQPSLTTYLKKFRPEAAGYVVPSYLAPTSKRGDNGGEGDLDIQMGVSSIWPLNVTWYSYGDGSQQKTLSSITFEGIAALPETLRPKVISISYSAGESFTDADTSAAECASAQKLTALGTTIVVSSGDGGVGCVPRGSNDTRIRATYPGTCPYIVSVGATAPYNYDAAPDIAPEVLLGYNSLDEVESGAGISYWYKRPNFQTEVVDKYLTSSANQAKGNYSENGRFIPDISSLGSRFLVNTPSQNGWVKAQGTSVSAPLLASMIALVNAKRRENGLDSIGFVHPKMYKGTYTDITKGSLYLCQNKSYPGLNCTTGFDIAGLGSPSLADLFKVLVD
ncbi:unnamed protein product [Sympodiomycopsis kandeliae]